MMESNTTCSPNMVKYYVFVAISFLVAISFHANVYHRFGAMEKDLNEAAKIKFTMEWDELKAFGYYLESVKLHRQGINDTMEAFQYAAAAESLRESIFEEEVDLQRLKQEAKEKEQQAEIDTRKSAMDGMSSFQNDRASIGSAIAGMNLAMQAEEENERSEKMMNRTAEEEALGKMKLREAQEALQAAEMAQNTTALNKGICKWAPVICRTVRTNDGGRNQNQTAPVTASDAVIQANRDIQNALQMIHKAEEERSEAIELHQNASIHANLSTELLHDAQAFQNQSAFDLKEAEEYRTIAAEEKAEAQIDELMAEQEEADIALKEIEMENDAERSAYLFKRVITDRYREHYAIERMNRDIGFVEKRRIELEQKVDEATHHVARAGWEALVASVSALCLLVLVTTRIVATFRYRRPIRWILREPPLFSQDLWYLVCHICIFVVAMGYVGELLMTFHDQTNVARAGITVIFALCAAVLQVTLLHVFPSVYELYRESRIDADSIRLLVQKVIIQKGIIIALVSAIEMQLCWCWMGTVAFAEVHKWNNYAVWLVTLCVSVGYGIFLRTQESVIAEYLPTHESNSLLAPSFPGSTQGFSPDFPASMSSANTQTPNGSSDSSPSLQSIPVGESESYDDDNYGSLSKFFRAHLSTSPLNFSWKSELEKVCLLMEFWLASLALWIIRRDLELIRKLSPLSTGLVWGQVPLWILNICLFLIFATLIVSFANMKFVR